MDNPQIVSKIERLKQQKQAIILAHNYQLGEVQEVADFVGDSLALSRQASHTPAEIIVFCGVRFMAETASILSPQKKVLMPDPNAGCPMAEMITRAGLQDLKKRHPAATVVGYINTNADVKAEIDICCTSTNAVKIVQSLNDKETIFVPDKYLAYYVSAQTKHRLIPWNGYCPTHVKILPEDILRQKKAHPQAEVMVHPECTPAVIELAGRTLSTEGMCKYAQGSEVKEFIVGTEIGLLYRLRKENPAKQFYAAAEQAICPSMKLTTLEKVLWCLEDEQFEVKVPQDIRIKAKAGVDRMLELA